MDHWADYLILAGFMAVSLSIGIYHGCTGGKQRTTEEFFVNNRRLKVLPTALSMLMSFQSAIILMGGTAEFYTGGITFLVWASIGAMLGLLIVERLIIPWLYPLRLTSVYRYFEMRYGRRDIRVFVSLLGSVPMVMYSGVATYACSVALQAATGFPIEASIPIMLVVCVIYTAMGGIRAVVWTDVMQGIIMIVGIFVVLVKGFMVVGGVSEALAVAEEENRLVWYNLDPDPRVRHTVWGLLIAFPIYNSVIYGLNQAAVQRYSGVKTFTGARKIPLLIMLPYLFNMVTTFGLGVTVLAYYSRAGCDPVMSGQARTANSLLPLFVRTVFKPIPGFSGFFLAILYSGGLSSVSSALSGVSACVWEDILQPRFRQLSPYKAATITKCLVALFGSIAMAFSFLVDQIPGPILQVQMSLNMAVYGPVLGSFLISGLRIFRWVRAEAVMVSASLAYVVLLWISVGAVLLGAKRPSLPPMSVALCDQTVNVTNIEKPSMSGIENVYSLSYIWYCPLGCIITVLCSSLLSLLINSLLGKAPEKKWLSDKVFINLSSVYKWDMDIQDNCEHNPATQVEQTDTPLEITSRQDLLSAESCISKENKC